MKHRAFTWICPGLCGCELRMSGGVHSDDLPVPDGKGRMVSYRHPIPFTITELAIESVCPAHKPILGQPLDDSPFLDLNEETGEMVQNRGYLRYPIANPTDAEKLYTYLWRYTLNRLNPDTCGCQVWLYYDRLAKDPTPVILAHPRTHKCIRHRKDDDQHTAAFADNALVNAVRDELAKQLTDADACRVFFDAQSNLVVRVPSGVSVDLAAVAPNAVIEAIR